MILRKLLNSFSAFRNMDFQWSDLPEDILQHIAQNLTAISDYIRFRSVCTSWRSSARLLDFPTEFWLLLPYEPSTATLPFLNVATKRIREVYVPQARDKAVCGSSFGWLFMLDTAKSLALLNPITKAKIDLPSTSSLPKYQKHAVCCKDLVSIAYAWDASLSSSPGDPSSDCFAIVCPGISKFLAVCRLGDVAWTLIDTGVPNWVCAFLYHKGRIYVVDDRGTSVVLDVETGSKLAIIASPIIASPVRISAYIFQASSSKCQFYLLMKSPEELLLVADYRRTKGNQADEEIWLTFGTLFVDEECIETFQLNLKGEFVWSKTESIGDRALFLSANKSSVTCAHGASGIPGLAEDCIYFDIPHLCYWGLRRDDDDNKAYYLDMFDIKANDFQLLSFHCEKPQETGQRFAIWVTPSLC